MTDGRWIKVAMTDATLVADVLIRLRQADAMPPRPLSTSKPLQYHWSVRQRRSRAPLKHAGKNDSATRVSPTTPLSWSGATSVSGGGADGVDESTSRLATTTTARPFDNARSKGVISSETTAIKRSRKKKTLAELREEESSLVQERSHLKRELMNLRITVEKHRATNESLKKIKLDVQSQQSTKTVMASVTSEGTIPKEVQKMEEDCVCPPSNSPTGGACNNLMKHQNLTADCCDKLEEVGTKDEAHCLLPDLNLPIEEPDSELLCGMS